MEHISGTYIGLPDNLEELGYTEGEIITNLQGAARQEASLVNGALEMSNVNLSKEIDHEADLEKLFFEITANKREGVLQ